MGVGYHEIHATIYLMQCLYNMSGGHVTECAFSETVTILFSKKACVVTQKETFNSINVII